MGAADKSKLQAAAAKLANAAKAIHEHQEGPADLGESPADDLLSAEELAVEVDRHVATIHRWANAGFISYISVGKGKHKLFRTSIVKTLRREVPATAAEKEKA